MRRLLRFPSFYLAAPLLISCLAAFASFRLPTGYARGAQLLLGFAGAFVAFDLLLRVRLPAASSFREAEFAGTREGRVGVAFAAVVAAFCLIDLAFFPIPLLTDPSSYANWTGGRIHVRHISNMSWVLPPLALLCLRRRAWRAALIAFGFIFPILVLDRNRLIQAGFSLLLVLALRRRRPAFPWKGAAAAAAAIAALFSALGHVRTGSLVFLRLPFSRLFAAVPEGLKWLLLYAGAGVYNFGSILAKHYRNPHFLINQLVPLHGSVATAGTGIPLDARVINAGTEFFPFLMAFGWTGAAFGALALYAMLLGSVQLLHRRIGLFHFLIFLRVAYVCAMCPFAPQAFIWTNFGFIILCGLLAAGTALLPRREPAADAHHA